MSARGHLNVMFLTWVGWQNVENVSRQLAYRINLDQSERRSTKLFARPRQKRLHINLRPVPSVRILDEFTYNLKFRVIFTYSPLSSVRSFILNIGTQGVQELSFL